ncbi:MltF family protein [Ferrimonas aestuarii]|nr:transglycosylase SLT domain-containing protein [Ferrimonas aestuarii]
MRIHPLTLNLWLFALLLFVTGNLHGEELEPSPLDDVWPVLTEPWGGDLDNMLERGEIRVLTSFGLGWFYFDAGHPRGITVENTRNFEAFIKRALGAKAKLLKVTVIPVSRDKLIPYLVEGYGDVIFANLTITTRRLQLIDFSKPYASDVKELLITHKDNAPATMAELAGTTIWLREESSYYDSVLKLNRTLIGQNLAPLNIELIDPRLQDEDLLRWVNAGLIEATVIDQHKLPVWQQWWPDLVAFAEPIRAFGELAYGIRKQSPELKALVDRYALTYQDGGRTFNILKQRFLESDRWLTRLKSEKTRDRQKQYKQWFQEFGKQYQFDWVLLSAFAFQESKYDANAKSDAGAIGIMQVLPSTAKELGFSNLTDPNTNIHAGTRYLAKLRDDYFNDPDLDEFNRTIFAMAAYNAGPNRINRLRRMAKSRGLDPDVWFQNVELLASAYIGRETVTYVANIYRHFVIHKRILSEQAQKGPLLLSPTPEVIDD